MTAETLVLLERAARRLEVESGDELGVSFRDKYSGRSMYGSSTGAITGGLGSIMMVVAQAAALATEDGDSAGFEALLLDLGAVGMDNMGRDLVIY
jgi:hypothetical protein